jgi:hypothetical protein
MTCGLNSTPPMPDLNEQCWAVIGTLGADDGDELPPAAVVRLAELGTVEWRDGKPRLTPYGERAYVVLESGDGEVPGLE